MPCLMAALGGGGGCRFGGGGEVTSPGGRATGSDTFIVNFMPPTVQ